VGAIEEIHVRQAEVYVVRVYRREAGGPTGVVEDVERGTSQTFRTASQLIDFILRRPDDETATQTKDPRKP
jgi:hypothetical protein